MLEAQPDGIFGSDTKSAVRTFQSSRGLQVTGTCEEITWIALVESGFHLGDRLLYLRQPLFRGDDVAELQFRLGSLGFDPGRVDGMLGIITLQAIKEFQADVGLPPDGIVGPTTVEELLRVPGRSPEHVQNVKERERLRTTRKPLREASILLFHPGYLESPAELVCQRLRSFGATSHPFFSTDQSSLAQIANRFACDVSVYLHSSSSSAQIGYYSGFSYTSSAGLHLANLMAQELSSLLPQLTITQRGMTLPILRETRMPSVAISMAPPSLWVSWAPELADAIVNSLRSFIQSPP